MFTVKDCAPVPLKCGMEKPVSLGGVGQLVRSTTTGKVHVPLAPATSLYIWLTELPWRCSGSSTASVAE